MAGSPHWCLGRRLAPCRRRVHHAGDWPSSHIAHWYANAQFIWHGEAENGVRIGSMRLGTDASGASACQYVFDRDLQPGSGVTFAVNVPFAGSYYLWARAMGLDWNRNSFWISVNGAPSFHYEIGQIDGEWTWGWEQVHVEGQAACALCPCCRGPPVSFRAASRDSWLGAFC